MPEITKAPNFADLIAWRDQLNSEWGSGGRAEGLDTRQENEEKLYFQKFDIEAPEGKLSVKSGSAPSDADAAIDSIVPQDIAVKVPPLRKRQKYETQAHTLEQFALALIKNWRRQRDVIRKLASDQVIRSYGVARVLVNRDLWPEKPGDLIEVDPGIDPEDDGQMTMKLEVEDDWYAIYRRKNPITFEVRNPRTVRWREDSSGNILVVVEYYATTALEAQLAFQKYPKAQKILQGRLPNETIYITDVWYGKWRCIAIDDQAILPGKEGVLPHGYKEIPYAVAPFRELSFDDVSERYRGMLTNAEQLYKIESQVLTMHVWMLAWNAWRTWKGYTTDGRDIEIFPGQVTTLNKDIGEYVEMLEGDPVPPELLQTAGVIDNYIQRNSTAQGPRSQEGTRSAQQVWAIQSIRQMKVEPAKQAMERLLERCLTLAMQHIETILDDKLTLPAPGYTKDGDPKGEATIKPSDIDGYTDGFEVSFSKRMDPAMLEQAKGLMALAINNWMPLKTSFELSGLTDNAQQWVDELLLQSVDHQPAMIQAAALQRVLDYYDNDPNHPMVQAFMGMMQQAKAGAGAPGAPGQPPGGGAGMQATSAMPTGPQGAGAGPGSLGQQLGQATPRRRSRAAGATSRTSTPPSAPRPTVSGPPLV